MKTDDKSSGAGWNLLGIRFANGFLRAGRVFLGAGGQTSGGFRIEFSVFGVEGSSNDPQLPSPAAVVEIGKGSINGGSSRVVPAEFKDMVK
ncbi:hypothetical protein HPP92_016530 [Vanilla planifolia]|uniref:Uncharacterized protein n=1 Tax=Vanilla planifolia TaxID=51239 RepID=A0A835UQJ7_VANPL|nr:hypothetical protein HPP92_027664 [Vanilla planifolia]KAG0471984.1 hypothetical protein HPP92_016530 [Vanilla planifolia]